MERAELFAALTDSADRLVAAARAARDRPVPDGEWGPEQVVRHLIDSEVAYAKVIGFLRSNPVELENASDADVASPAAAAAALERVRARLLALVDGVEEATFYDLRALGKEQYSVLSVLENIASHDHEHVEQLRKTLAR